MDLDIQGMVDKVHERKILDKFIPVTRYEQKQKETRNNIKFAELTDEVQKLRGALVDEGIAVAEKATDEEIISAILMEEDKYEHQMEVNNYNERVTRYNEGSLVERVRIMFNGAPAKPNAPYTGQEEDVEEETEEEVKQSSKPVSPGPVQSAPVEEELEQEEIDEIEDILSNVDGKDLNRLELEGKSADAANLANEIQNVLANIKKKKSPLEA